MFNVVLELASALDHTERLQSLPRSYGIELLCNPFLFGLQNEFEMFVGY